MKKILIDTVKQFLSPNDFNIEIVKKGKEYKLTLYSSKNLIAIKSALTRFFDVTHNNLLGFTYFIKPNKKIN